MDFIKRTDAFKRVKSEFTSGWVGGGLLSLAGSAFIFMLILSEFSNYLQVRTLSEVQMSANSDAQVKINVNISLPKLPCQFASLDVRDVIGTNRMNITTNIRKWKLTAHGEERSAEMTETASAPKHEVDDKHPEDPVDKAQVLSNNNFDSFITTNELVLVNFYAPWCHWSRRLMPTWHNTASVISKKPYGYNTKIAMVDCTHADAVQTCRKAHVNAFPMVAVYRGNTETHEFYHGDRTTEAFVKFIENIRSNMNHEDGKFIVCCWFFVVLLFFSFLHSFFLFVVLDTVSSHLAVVSFFILFSLTFFSSLSSLSSLLFLLVLYPISLQSFFSSTQSTRT